MSPSRRVHESGAPKAHARIHVGICGEHDARAHFFPLAQPQRRFANVIFAVVAACDVHAAPSALHRVTHSASSRYFVSS